MNRNSKKLLKTFLNKYYNGQDFELCDESLSKSYSSDIETRKALSVLSAKNLIIYQQNITGEIFEITLTDRGITYFDDIRDKRIRFWLPFAISVISFIGSFRNEISMLFSLICKK